MEIMIKLPTEKVQKDVVDLMGNLETKLHESKQWLTLTVYYKNTDISQLSYYLDTLLKEMFEHSDRIGMRINEMPYIATSDNKNVRAIMEKLLK